VGEETCRVSSVWAPVNRINRLLGHLRPSAATCPLVYNALVIGLALTAMSIATWLFFVGVCGSLIVVLISFFEDLTELVGKE